MERKEELLKVFEGNDCKPVVINLIDDVVYLENKLTEYKTILNETPITPATKDKYKFYHSLYKEDLQQYTNIVGKLSIALGKSVGDSDESPLREFSKMFKGDNS